MFSHFRFCGLSLLVLTSAITSISVIKPRDLNQNHSVFDIIRQHRPRTVVEQSTGILISKRLMRKLTRSFSIILKYTITSNNIYMSTHVPYIGQNSLESLCIIIVHYWFIIQALPANTHGFGGPPRLPTPKQDTTSTIKNTAKIDSKSCLMSWLHISLWSWQE